MGQRVLITWFYFKFHEIPVSGYSIMANFVGLNHLKGCNLICNTRDSLTKAGLHHGVIVIYKCIKFHEIPYSGYLVMAPDRRKDGRTDGLGQNNIPPPSPGDNNESFTGTDGIWVSFHVFSHCFQGQRLFVTSCFLPWDQTHFVLESVTTPG